MRRLTTSFLVCLLGLILVGWPGGQWGRDGSWGQTDIVQSMPKMWLDAGYGVTYDGSSRVSSWADKSGNGKDAAQATGDYRPIYTTDVVNGKPAVHFDGTDDYMDLQQLVGDDLSEATMIVVALCSNRGYPYRLIEYNEDDVYMKMAINYTQINNATWHAWDGVGIRTVRAEDFCGAYWYIYTYAIKEHDKLYGWINNVSMGTSSIGALQQSETVGLIEHRSLGRAGMIMKYYDGYIAEVIIYSKLLTDAKRTKVINELGEKYDIPIGVDNYFRPTDISGCEFWVDANSGVTQVADRVSAWADRSGNGNNATQATAGNQPLYVSDGMAPVDCKGRPTIRFTTDDYLSANSLSTLFTGSDKPLSIFAVVAKSANDANHTIFCVTNPPSLNSFYSLETTNIPRWKCRRKDDAALQKTGAVGLPDTNPNIISNTFAGTLASLYVNGTATLVDGDLDVGTMTVDQATIGVLSTSYTNYLEGDLSELIIYDTALSTADRQDVEEYLSNKYGVIVGWTPADLSGLMAWWDPDVEVTYDGADRISELTEQTSGGYDATQTTDAQKPLYDAGPLAYALYDGTDDFLDLTTHIAAFQALTSGTFNAWVYVSTGTDDPVISASNNAWTTNYGFVRINDSDEIYIRFKRAGGDVVHLLSDDAVPLDEMFMLTYATDATGNSVYVNGEPADVTYTTGDATTQAFFSLSDLCNVIYLGFMDLAAVAFDEYMTGRQGESLVYDVRLTDAEVLRIYTEGKNRGY